MTNSNKDWKLLEFYVPLQEFGMQDNKFKIKGTAITETTTKNNHKYIAEELEKSAKGMMGKPLLIDHDNSVKSIKGRVTNSYFDNITRSIQFEGEVMDKEIQVMIERSDNGFAVWEMPDVNKWRSLHKDLPFLKDRNGR